jgi:hypothetical protein
VRALRPIVPRPGTIRSGVIPPRSPSGLCSCAQLCPSEEVRACVLVYPGGRHRTGILPRGPPMAGDDPWPLRPSDETGGRHLHPLKDSIMPWDCGTIAAAPQQRVGSCAGWFRRDCHAGQNTLLPPEAFSQPPHVYTMPPGSAWCGLRTIVQSYDQRDMTRATSGFFENPGYAVSGHAGARHQACRGSISGI